MRLAVDTHHLLLENAGTKRVTENLLSEFAKIAEVEVIPLRPSYSLSLGTGTIGKIWGYLARFYWVNIQLPIKCLSHKADLLLSPEYHTPLFTHCVRAVIAHDAHIRAQREFISPVWFYLLYIPFIEPAIRRADLIFTVSEYSKQEVVKLMKIKPEKVHVVYNGLDRSFFELDKEELKPVFGLKPKEYILFIGTFEARKNVERLIDAFALYKNKNNGRSEMKLVIAGKASTGKFSNRGNEIRNRIKSLNIENDVVLTGFVPDSDLPALCANSYVIAFPSLYEGFGLPILEGFACGVPVVTSDICSMPEIAENAALLVDPYSVGDIAEKLEQLTIDQKLRDGLIERGNARVKKFTWQDSANQMISIIKSTVYPS